MTERNQLAREVLAAWCNVPVDQLPGSSEWINHPNDMTRQAWDRVIAAAQAPVIAELRALSYGMRTALYPTADDIPQEVFE